MKEYKSGDKQELFLLNDLLSKAIDSTRGVLTEDEDEYDRLVFAHNLSNKFINHASTLIYLLDGTVIKKSPSFPEHTFIDAASIDVLTRSVMEAFLVFHFVFFTPKTQEEKSFRYLIYKATGIAERQPYPVELMEHRKILDDEKTALEKICDKLKTNGYYMALSDNQRKSFMQGKELDLWRWNFQKKKRYSFYEIGIDAGFSIVIASYFYRHLSGYTHSGSLSVLQSAQAMIKRETDTLTNASIDLMKILVSFMINEYCQMFTAAATILENSSLKEQVQLYIIVGKHLGEGWTK